MHETRDSTTNADETNDSAKELKEEMQLTAFQIIACAGNAKSSYMEALTLARGGDIAGAKKKMDEGKAAYAKAHGHHFPLISKEARGVDLPFSLLLTHAEDQLLTTETIQLLSAELITIYDQLHQTRVE